MKNTHKYWCHTTFRWIYLTLMLFSSVASATQYQKREFRPIKPIKVVTPPPPPIVIVLETDINKTEWYKEKRWIKRVN